MTRDRLEILAKKLMFEMNDLEYETLEREFEIISRTSSAVEVSGERPLMGQTSFLVRR